MLLGSEIGAALTALEPLGIDLIGLNCATGPAEMSEHLRYLARHSRIAAVRACRTPACRCSTKDGAHYPLDARRAGRRAGALRPRATACPWSAAAAAPRPSTCARSSSGSAAATAGRAQPAARARRRLALPDRARSARTPPTWRSASAPTPTARRSSARPCWRAAGTTAWRWPATRSARAPTCSTSASTTSAATASPTWRELAGRFATASTLPIVLDSTEVDVLRAGLEKLGGRAVINSVNYEDGDGPESRFAKVTAAGPGARRRADRADHRRGGPGPHRREEGRRSPSG